MMDAEILVCEAVALLEGGKGIRFPLRAGGEDTTGFVVRYGGKVYGYLNRCAHVPIELDWAEGEFFESSGYISCVPRTAPSISLKMANAPAAHVAAAACARLP